MKYVASSQCLHPRRYLDGLRGRKKPWSRKAVSSDTLNIDILIVGRAPELEQNESSRSKSSDNIKNQHVATGSGRLPVSGCRI